MKKSVFLLSREDVRLILNRDLMTLLSALSCFVAVLVVTFNRDDSTAWPWMAIGTSSALGISYFIAVAQAFDGRRKLIANAIGIAVFSGFAVYGISLGVKAAGIFGFRALYLALLTHLLIAVAILGRQNFREKTMPFWQYNWFVLTRLIYAAVCSIIFAGGLTAALTLVPKLFGGGQAEMLPDTAYEVNWVGAVPAEAYAVVWAFAIILLNTVLVLAALNRVKEAVEEPEVPRELMVLAQWIFTPLSMVYTAIILAYLVRLLARQEWPSGGVGYLVSGLTFMVILSYLIQRPMEEKGLLAPFFRNYWKWSFALLLPPLFTLAVAIYLRVNQYGWTEPRYYLAMLTVWAIGVAFYYLRPFRRGIAVIPLSLFVMGLLTWMGPLSGKSAETRSQSARFDSLMKEYGAQWDGEKYKYRESLSIAQIDKLRGSSQWLCRNLSPSDYLKALEIPQVKWPEPVPEHCYALTVGSLSLEDFGEKLLAIGPEKDTAQGRRYFQSTKGVFKIPQGSGVFTYFSAAANGSQPLELADGETITSNDYQKGYLSWVRKGARHHLVMLRAFDDQKKEFLEFVGEDGTVLRIHSLNVGGSIRGEDVQISSELQLLIELRKQGQKATGP